MNTFICIHAVLNPHALRSSPPSGSLNHSLLSAGLLTNRWALSGALAMVGAQLLFTYVPVMNRLFHSAPIGAESWLRVVGVAAVVFVAVEIEKWIRFRRGRDTRAMKITSAE